MPYCEPADFHAEISQGVGVIGKGGDGVHHHADLTGHKGLLGDVFILALHIIGVGHRAFVGHALAHVDDFLGVFGIKGQFGVIIVEDAAAP